MSVIPCRLNGDLHEWFNEMVTVPTIELPKIPSWCKGQGRLVGSGDLVDLYCSLLLCFYVVYIVYLGETKRIFGKADQQCNTRYTSWKHLLARGHQHVGSLAGVAPSRKDSWRAQW